MTFKESAKVLEVRNLKKVFREDGQEKTVLEGISFSLSAGECLGLVGRSGCGKSTTVRLVSRLLAPDEGEILLCHEDITHLKGCALAKAYENMQMIFQMPEDSFDPRKTLGWSIAEPLLDRGWEKARREARVRELLAEVGLEPSFAERYSHEVSGGQCQRAALARAIALSPKLLICDEATSALDVTVQSRIVELIKKLCRKKRMACLFITHDLALLPGLADRVLVMHGGRIVEEGETCKVVRSPESPYTRELLEADFFHLT